MQELYIKYFKSFKFSKKNYCTVIDQNTDRQIKMVKVRICDTKFDDMKASCLQKLNSISEKEAQRKYSVKKHYNFKDYIEKKKKPIKSAPCVQFCLVCNYLKNIKVIKQYHDTDNISAKCIIMI